MKIQLDTKNKVIKVEEKVNLEELISTLALLLPKEKWKEFDIEPCVINNWYPSIMVEMFPVVEDPYWKQPWIVCDANTQISDFNKTHFTII